MQSISPLVISDENFNQIIEENPIVVVDFWAEWCGPCRAMNPMVEELSSIYENKIVFAKLNVDKNPIIPSKYGISSIPTFLIIKNGQVMNSIIGAITQELFEAINQVGVAAAQEGSTPVLTGILFDSKEGKTKLVATDSYRLASKELVDFPVKDLGVVSKKALSEVVRLFEERETKVGVVVREREVFFDDGVYQASLRKIEGDYPKHKDLFPKETVFSIETEKDKIMEALDRSSVVAEGYIPIKISFSKDSLKITSINQDIGGGKEEVPCKFLGVDIKEVEKFEMSFNPTYLMEAISVLVGGRVYFRFSGNQKPLLIQGETDNYQHLLMPVRSD